MGRPTEDEFNARLRTEGIEVTKIVRDHDGYCWTTCGCLDSDEFDWDGFAADINGDPT